MPPYKKEDLKYSYNWDEDSLAATFRSINQDDTIDRCNGYQMLEFINRFLSMNGLFSISSLYRLEKLICRYMPEKINTRSEMKSWLGQNWNKHFH